MCQFLSALVLRNGDVLTHPVLDSHGDLVQYFKLPDVLPYHQHFAKVELAPVDWLDVATWTFRLDKATAPGWWTDVAPQAEATLRDRAARMILCEGTHQLIVDGCWIVGGTARVIDVRAGRLVHVQDAAHIQGVGGSARIQHVGGSAHIESVGGSARIQYVGDSAHIEGVGDSAHIEGVGGSARIQHVGGSARIQHVRGSAHIEGVTGSAHIEGVGGSAHIQYVGGSARIEGVTGSARLDTSAQAHLVSTEL